MLFQNYTLFPWRSVAENISFGLELQGLSKLDRQRQVAYYLEVVGLTKFADAYPKQLSGGMKQRVAIARKVDAATIYEPFVGKALKGRSGSKVLYTAKGTNTIANGLAADSSILKTRRGHTLAYLRAFAKGMKFAQANPQEANELIAKWVGATPIEVTAQMAQIKLLDMAANKSIVFDEANPLNVVSSINSAAPILLKAGKISKILPGKDLVDGSFVKAI
jgi:ABC-type nitrate/sulfonate/bicarbonate transport system substrate-binding protein